MEHLREICKWLKTLVDFLLCHCDSLSKHDPKPWDPPFDLSQPKLDLSLAVVVVVFLFVVTALSSHYHQGELFLIAREDRKSFSNTSSSIFSYQSHQARVQPTGGGGHREQQFVGAVIGLPDLSVCAMEEEEQQQDQVRWWKHRQQQLLAYRAATSLARRRRVQIQTEKRFSLLSYNSKTLYAFTNDTLAMYSYATSLQATLRYGIPISLVQGLGLDFTYGLAICSCALQLWVGRFLISNGKANGGEIITALFAVILSSIGLNQAAINFYSFEQGRIDAYKLFEMISCSNSSLNQDGSTLVTMQGNIEFRNVYFNYLSRPEILILSGFYQNVPARKTVALVGRNDSRKVVKFYWMGRYKTSEVGMVEKPNWTSYPGTNFVKSAKGPAFIVERIELLDLGVDQSFNVPTISSGWLAGSGWGISTMDWLGQSQYLRQTVFWPSLSSAVSELLKQVIFSKHALLNMLVTYWSHFLDGTDEYLKSILYSTILCHSSSRNNCKGRVNIKYYIVPGYKKTGATKSNKDRCADDKLKKMALRVIAESLSEEEIAGLKEAIPCDPPFEIPEGPSYTCRGRRRHF
ncbi:hypothetical protein ZIOFF_047842 [Zingiber officinale]|uniref:ABC transmembrane type-1 domain-containing protein n=1 Tax=Zingiber officinale TaxID=94328 RepID=A0A8J5KX37_ZINOF|nr:hypothetical protein ZIOFF_047842 [Zingiber officinale]